MNLKVKLQPIRPAALEEPKSCTVLTPATGSELCYGNDREEDPVVQLVAGLCAEADPGLTPVQSSVLNALLSVP